MQRISSPEEHVYKGGWMTRWAPGFTGTELVLMLMTHLSLQGGGSGLASIC